MTERDGRHILLEGSSNLRDVGGYLSADGRTIRWGQIYRSGALGRLSDSDWGWMVDHDIGSVCDLRSGDERVLVPTDWRGAGHTRHLNVAYEAELIFGSLKQSKQVANLGEMGNSLYAVFPRLLAPAFKSIFAALLDSHTPIIVHCSAGQDRTGLAIGLILAALEIPRDLIFEDFLLSTDARKVSNEIDHDRIVEFANKNIAARFYAELLEEHGEAGFVPRHLVNPGGDALLGDAFAFIESEWGSLEEYLERELGVTAVHRERLRELYLEI